MMISLPRAVVVLLGALALSTVANAQGPVGVWTTKMDFNGNIREATLTIAKGAGDALSGTWSSARGESELTNVVFQAGTLSFLRNVSFNGQDFEIAFEGKIEGDTLKGALITDFGEMEVTGTRAAVPTKVEGATLLVGTWNGTSAILGRTTSWALVVAEDLSAVVETEGGSMAVRDLALKGDKLSYVLAVASKGQKFELAFAGTLSQSTFSGRYSLPGLGEIAEVTAAKAETKPKADTKAKDKATDTETAVMVGTWTLVGESDMGRQESSMVINADLTGSVDFGEFGVFKLDYVEVKGDLLGWGVAADFGEQQVYIEFEGRLDGEKFTGSLWAGDREVASMSGTKKKKKN